GRPRAALPDGSAGRKKMNLELTEDQLVLQKSIRDFCARNIVPFAAKWDEEERFPAEVIQPMAELGLLGMHVPESYGGAGMKLHKGLSAFVVEKGTPGFRAGKHIEKMGLRASDTTELILEDVVVPDEQRLGQIDHGFFDTLKVLDRGRIGIGAWAVGIGRAAY